MAKRKCSIELTKAIEALLHVSEGKGFKKNPQSRKAREPQLADDEEDDEDLDEDEDDYE